MKIVSLMMTIAAFVFLNFFPKAKVLFLTNNGPAASSQHYISASCYLHYARIFMTQCQAERVGPYLKMKSGLLLCKKGYFVL